MKKKKKIVKKTSTRVPKSFDNNRVYNNQRKKRIAQDMLDRYTGSDIKDFNKFIILTNFDYYLQEFVNKYDAKLSNGSVFRVAHSAKLGVSMIDFKVGSPTAALVVELLSSIAPSAVLFLGMVGGLHRSLRVGDFILPMAAIRDEGVSRHFLPRQVPAMPTFKIQKFVSQILVEKGLDYRTGVVHTTDYRFWEFNESFKDVLYSERALGIEMECAALFIAGFASKVPTGALLLVSDTPLKRGGIKTKKSSKKVFKEHTSIHLAVGIKAMAEIRTKGENIRHYQW